MFGVIRDVADVTIFNGKRKDWISCVVQGIAKFHITRGGRTPIAVEGAAECSTIVEMGANKSRRSVGRNDDEAVATWYVKAAAKDDLVSSSTTGGSALVQIQYTAVFRVRLTQ